MDTIDRAVTILNAGEGGVDADTVLQNMTKVTQAELGFPMWGETDKRRLIDGIKHHGNDIEEISDHISSKKLKDVVKRYYIVHG